MSDFIKASVSFQAYIWFAFHFRMSVKQGASREGFYTYTSLPWQGWLVVTFIQVGISFLVSAQISNTEGISDRLRNALLRSHNTI